MSPVLDSLGDCVGVRFTGSRHFAGQQIGVAIKLLIDFFAHRGARGVVEFTVRRLAIEALKRRLSPCSQRLFRRARQSTEKRMRSH